MSIQTPAQKQRFVELDLLRTLAIVLMVIYHAAYDLTIWYGWQIPLFTGGWLMMARTAASLFLLLVGVSFVVAHHRAKAKGNPWPRVIRRASMVLGGALMVTIATHILIPEQYVRFGILHLIGTSLLLLPLFMRLKEGNILLGIAVFILGQFTFGTRGHVLLLPFGFVYPGFTTIDYFPLLPWLGVILIGAGIGHFLYIRHLAWLTPLSLVLSPLSRWWTWPGRHSLMVYLLHQPILWLIWWMVLGKPMI
jgi:uncharacterized membrane protein